MSADKLLEALGATDENEALRMMAETNQFLQDVKEATGRDSFDGARSVLRSAIPFAREIEKHTDKPMTEAIGVVLAWKSSHDKLPAVEAKVTELEESIRVKDVMALIAQGLQKPGPGASEHAGKITPATAEYWKTRNVSEVRQYLAVAPRVLEMQQRPPTGDPKESAHANTAASAAFSGRKYEDITPSERAELNETDPLLYNALRDDWIVRGEPAGKLAEVKRASNGAGPLTLGITST